MKRASAAAGDALPRPAGRPAPQAGSESSGRGAARIVWAPAPRVSVRRER